MIANRDPTVAWSPRVAPRLQALVERAVAGELSGDALVADSLFSGSPEALRQYGLQVRSVAGNIAMPSIALADVPAAARAAPVRYMQFGGGLRPDPAS